jgi:hypothetical protein
MRNNQDRTIQQHPSPSLVRSPFYNRFNTQTAETSGESTIVPNELAYSRRAFIDSAAYRGALVV